MEDRRAIALFARLLEHQEELDQARFARGVSSNLTREISLQELADAAGMSLYHFAKSFKQTTGCPPHRYLTEQRLRQARILLHDATLPIGDVAKAVGFSHSRFAVLFTRYMAMTPTKFRDVLRS